jgi:hypothetical protein
VKLLPGERIGAVEESDLRDPETCPRRSIQSWTVVAMVAVENPPDL